jgi:hypothetical protein
MFALFKSLFHKKQTAPELELSMLNTRSMFKGLSEALRELEHREKLEADVKAYRDANWW